MGVYPVVAGGVGEGDRAQADGYGGRGGIPQCEELRLASVDESS